MKTEGSDKNGEQTHFFAWILGSYCEKVKEMRIDRKT